MSFPILPDVLRPGKDLMCKLMTQSPKVINIITKTLNNIEDDYLISKKFQHRVDKKFMTPAITYCIQASGRYGRDPILVVVGINCLSIGVKQLAKQSRVQGCYSFPCDVWASECFILCHSSIAECTLTEPLNLLRALGLFLMKGTASIIDTPRNDDETIQLLYSIAVEHYESVAGNTQHLIDVLLQQLLYRKL